MRIDNAGATHVVGTEPIMHIKVAHAVPLGFESAHSPLTPSEYKIYGTNSQAWNVTQMFVQDCVQYIHMHIEQHRLLSVYGNTRIWVCGLKLCHLFCPRLMWCLDCLRIQTIRIP